MMLQPFNLPQSPFDMKPSNYQTPGIGDGLPQNRPTQAFIWGQGGQRLTPEQILARDEDARQKMQADYSPVGHWAQGLARVVNNLTGALEQRQVDKASAANRVESDAVTQALLNGGSDNAAVMQAMVNPYVSDDVRNMAGIMFKAQQPKQSAPHYWETNNGSLGMVGPDGQPKILYEDPTPKMEMIQVRDPNSGQVNWYRVPVAGNPAPAAGKPPQGAIDFLRKNPGSAAQFDEKYGAGTSAGILGAGGGVGDGTGNFR